MGVWFKKEDGKMKQQFTPETYCNLIPYFLFKPKFISEMAMLAIGYPGFFYGVIQKLKEDADDNNTNKFIFKYATDVVGNETPMNIVNTFSKRNKNYLNYNNIDLSFQTCGKLKHDSFPIQFDHDGIPIVKILAVTESQYIIKCPYCDDYHIHGNTSTGHRNSHCSKYQAHYIRKYMDLGYILSDEK